MEGTRNQVQDLVEAGLHPSQIARRLGIARPTVEYHLERLAAREVLPADEPEPPSVRTQVPTRQLVVDLLGQELTRSAIAKELGLAKATVSYHARRAGAAIDTRCARRYDWRAIQRYYDQGHSLNQCRDQFGFSSQTWHAAVKRGAIVPRPVRLPSEKFFVAGVYRSRTYLKLRLIEEGHKEVECEVCGLREWRGGPR